jgi:hypoxanthine phosphoribosyltransferase
MVVPTTAGSQKAQGFPCELIGWEGFYRLARKLTQVIRASGFAPELMVAISRGGLVPARVLADQLNLFDLATLKIEHYQAMHKQTSARVRYPLTADVEGRRVLLVDDVSDTGDSLQLATDHLLERGRPALLRSAVLHHKRVSSYQPDYFAETVVEWRWIIYPWAVVEDLSGLWLNMEPRPASTEALVMRLQRDYAIEVPRQIIEDVMSLAETADREIREGGADH